MDSFSNINMQQSQVNEQVETVSTAQQNSLYDARFSCNICFEAVEEPVVTQCGHLYCWSCLYRWLEPGMYPVERARLLLNPLSAPPDSSRRVCPVCKASCSVNTIVPIYVRAAENTTTTNNLPQDKEKGDDNESPILQPSDSLNENINADNNSPVTMLDVEDEMSLQHAGSSSYEDFVLLEPRESQQPIGLRQRRLSTIDSQTSGISGDVPRRPAAAQTPDESASSPNPLTNTGNNSNGYESTSMVPMTSPSHQHQTASRAAMMLSAFIQDPAARRSTIPAIHRPEGFNHPNPVDSFLESDPGATEFLSRILLMLGSFVILCLLIF